MEFKDTKWAFVYRGISYQENYSHDNRSGMTPYHIDFDDCIPFLKKYLISPLRDKGAKVDFFFNTYKSRKLDSYIMKLSPVHVIKKKFDPNIAGSFDIMWNSWIESLQAVSDYQKKHNFYYDSIILTRFDLIFIEDITELFLPDVPVTMTSPGGDCFVILKDGRLLDRIISIFKKHKRNFSTHRFADILYRYNLPNHTIYGNTPESKDTKLIRGFYRISRDVLAPKGHIYRSHNLEDVFNPKSEFYRHSIKPNKILTPGHAVIDKRDRINLRLLKLRWFIEPSLFKPYSKIKREGAKR